MKALSRILTVILCCTPAFSAVAAGPVATTAGSNLTAYNPSDAYNNQWASLTNGRYDEAPSGPAKADFGNCNALVLRCAQPKCGVGGCNDSSVASGIVAGCVQSNEKCKKYGDDLVSYMTAQLVATSQTKLNQQQIALEQAKIQADAQAAAAAAANAQSAEQIAAMQSQMQQMQAQMAQQQQESAAQLQEALAQQQAQSQAALESMKTAATEAAMQTEAGISAYQQEAIDRGVSNDELLRHQLTGKIQTSIDDMNQSMTTLNRIMQNAFSYAGCTPRGDNCTGPKRVKKWRELASDFIEPYDDAVDKLEEALEQARIAGVDLSQIDAMLENACTSWVQYLCPGMSGGEIQYTDEGPKVCGPETECKQECHNSGAAKVAKTAAEWLKTCYSMCEKKDCKPCTRLKALTNDDDIFEGWMDTDPKEVNGQTTVVACGASALNRNRIIGGHSRRKSGAGVVSIDQMETWLYQRESDTKDERNYYRYCTVEDADLPQLKKSTQSRTVDKKTICKSELENEKGEESSEEECPYIIQKYGICDTHAYNYGTANDTPICKQGDKTTSCELSSDNIAKIKEVIGLKTTVISQQMYKQYEYLKATLRRFEILLNKAILQATFDVAGAKDEDGSSSRAGGLAGGGSSKNSKYSDCAGKPIQEMIYCLRQNYSALSEQVNSKKCNSAVKKQMAYDIDMMKKLIPEKNEYAKITECYEDSQISDCKKCLQTYYTGINTLDDVQLDREAKRQGRYRDY